MKLHSTYSLVFILCFWLVTNNTCFGQLEDSKIYTNTDTPPQFPAGNPELFNYIIKNLPLSQLEDCEEVSTKIIIQFVVEIDGSLSNFESIKSVCKNDLEIISNLLSSSPKWNPGELNGIAVRTQVAIPIQVHLR
jgi:hypothetical protein